jgi:hypothetical protein
LDVELKQEKQQQILRLTTPELKKTFGALFAQDDSRHFYRAIYILDSCERCWAGRR